MAEVQSHLLIADPGEITVPTTGGEAEDSNTGKGWGGGWRLGARRRTLAAGFG